MLMHAQLIMLHHLMQSRPTLHPIHSISCRNHFRWRVMIANCHLEATCFEEQRGNTCCFLFFISYLMTASLELMFSWSINLYYCAPVHFLETAHTVCFAGALAMESLHKQVLPFLLRRMKEDVLQDLPPKIIQDYHCELSPLQVLLYVATAKMKSTCPRYIICSLCCACRFTV